MTPELAIDSATKIDLPPPAAIEEISLHMEGKGILLVIDLSNQLAMTNIETTDHSVKKSGVTTELYELSLDLIQDAANTYRIPITYNFSTSNPKMINWALDTGKGLGVFNWDKWELDDSDDKDEGEHKKHFFAQKIIYPQEN